MYSQRGFEPTVTIDETSRTYRVARILAYLALKGPRNRYRIQRDTHAGSQPTVLELVDLLEQSNLIKVKGSDRQPRGGKISPRYVITAEGIFLLLSILARVSIAGIELDFEALAKMHPRAFPEIFDHIQLFLDEQITDLAFQHLIHIASNFIDDPEAFLSKDEHQRTMNIKGGLGPGRRKACAKTFFSFSGLLVETLGTEKRLERERWLKALRSNRKLREPFLEQMKKDRDLALGTIRIIDECAKYLNGESRSFDAAGQSGEDWVRRASV
jgi:hypothetical protein